MFTEIHFDMISLFNAMTSEIVVKRINDVTIKSSGFSLINAQATNPDRFSMKSDKVWLLNFKSDLKKISS